MSEDKPNILFLCTGNACRSQMAEGWAKALDKNTVEIQSAGIEAHGKNPRAIMVMQEIGIDISRQESTRVTDGIWQEADIIITVCDHADRHCPTITGRQTKILWPLSNPAKAEGSEEEIMAVFRQSRDDVKRRVNELLKNLNMLKLDIG